DTAPLALRLGARGTELDDAVEQLVERAYTRVDMVSRRGEFALRGGILDVFPPTSEHPYRVEFFGDEIDQIRAFSVADQRSLPGDVDLVELPATRELLLTAEVRDRARSLVAGFPAIAGMLEKMAEGIPVEGMESLLPAVSGPLKALVEYFPLETAVALVDPERSSARAQSLGETNREFLDAAWSAATSGASAPIDLGAGDFVSVARLREIVHERDGVWWRFSPFATDDDDAANIDASIIPSFHGNVDGAIDFVDSRLADGWRLVIAASGPGLVDRARDVLSDRGLAARVGHSLPDAP